MLLSRRILCLAVVAMMLGMFFSACVPTPEELPTPTATATATVAVPTPTVTPTPSPTPLPGRAVLPIEIFDQSVPWLPLDESARPSTFYVMFNSSIPPFDSALVRRAFAHAIDRQVVADMRTDLSGESTGPATTFTPPQTLGRDLYGEVGAVFDPQMARELLSDAGYSDPSGFPVATILVKPAAAYPYGHLDIVEAMVDMWQTHLGVSVEIEIEWNWNVFLDRVRTDPPEMFWVGWGADYNDPSNFLRDVFHSDFGGGFGLFSNPDFNQLVDRAQDVTDPSERQILYILAERMLCETEAAVIPLYHIPPMEEVRVSDISPDEPPPTGEEAIAAEAMLASALDHARWEFGPRSGRLWHNHSDDFFVWRLAFVQLRDFIAESVFVNPYSATWNTWDFGFGFRFESWDLYYRLVITSDREWFVGLGEGGYFTELDSGMVPNLQTLEGESNKLQIMVVGTTGYFFLNERFIDQFTLQEMISVGGGGVFVATGLMIGNEVGGYYTDYEDFTVWSLPD